MADQTVMAEIFAMPPDGDADGYRASGDATILWIWV